MSKHGPPTGFEIPSEQVDVWLQAHTTLDELRTCTQLKLAVGPARGHEGSTVPLQEGKQMVGAPGAAGPPNGAPTQRPPPQSESLLQARLQNDKDGVVDVGVPCTQMSQVLDVQAVPGATRQVFV